MLKIITRILFSRLFVRAVIFLFFIIFVLVAGPLFSFGEYKPLESFNARLIFILVCFGLLFLPALIRKLRSGFGARKLVELLKQQAQSQAEDSKEHPTVSAMANRFEEGIESLKGRLTSKNLYDLPWYIIIGPPGCGKTTALINSGLEFPLEDRYGSEALHGVSGTRNCDWWFTDKAVLIDTAGRYVSQDSDKEGDEAEWFGFLDLLKKYRRRRPINGVMVAISLPSLISDMREERLQHSLAIKQRLTELEERLNVKLPVYFLITKVDLLAGFVEIFEDLNQQEREQVWGATFDYSNNKGNYADIYEREFDLLIKQLNQRIPSRLLDERDIRRRGPILSFPQQLALHKDKIVSFIRDVFEAPSGGNLKPMLRGVYFTSGTQEGNPLDRLVGSLSNRFQLQQNNTSTSKSTGKSFFIHDLQTKIIFPESGLVSSNVEAERKLKIINNGMYIGVAALLVLVLGLWVSSYMQNKEHISNVALAVSDIGIKLDDVTKTSAATKSRLALIEDLRNIPGGFADSASDPSFGFGLSQYKKLRERSILLYERVLVNLLMPLVMQRLESIFSDGSETHDYRYEALKVYQMLKYTQHYDNESFNRFIQIDDMPTKLGLAGQGHLEALALNYDPNKYPVPRTRQSERLVQAVQKELINVSMSRWLYERIRAMSRVELSEQPGFTIYNAVGSVDAQRVFERKSGTSIREGIEPFYTKQGYSNFENNALSTVKQLMDERDWVLNEKITVSENRTNTLFKSIKSAYLVDYATQYRRLVDDISLVNFRSASDAIQILNLLSDPEHSPLIKLLEAIKKETLLFSAIDKAQSQIDEKTQSMRKWLTRNSGNRVSRAVTRMDVVSESFADLNATVTPKDDQPAPIMRLLELIAELEGFVAQVQLEESQGGVLRPEVAQEGQGIVQKLRIEANEQPSLVKNMLEDVAASSSGMAYGGIMDHLNQIWQAEPLEFCRQAISARYPIKQSSSNSIRLDDFGRFFGYGGVVDTFFDRHLKSYIDTSKRPWKNKASGSGQLALSASSLSMFERAEDIKRSYFGFGDNQPRVSFSMTPVKMDKRIGSFIMRMEGQEIRYEHGVPRTQQLVWPGPKPEEGVIITLNLLNGKIITKTERGAWAWYRYFKNTKRKQSRSNELFIVDFNIDGYKVRNEIAALSAFNPFRSNRLANFYCPGTLDG